MENEKPELSPVLKKALNRAIKRFKEALTGQALTGRITEADLDSLDFSLKSRQKIRDEQCLGEDSEGNVTAGSTDSELYRKARAETDRLLLEYNLERQREKEQNDEQS